jgi:co-chaperonin GroES (HSP10)
VEVPEADLDVRESGIVAPDVDAIGGKVFRKRIFGYVLSVGKGVRDHEAGQLFLLNTWEGAQWISLGNMGGIRFAHDLRVFETDTGLRIQTPGQRRMVKAVPGWAIGRVGRPGDPAPLMPVLDRILFRHVARPRATGTGLALANIQRNALVPYGEVIAAGATGTWLALADIQRNALVPYGEVIAAGATADEVEPGDWVSVKPREGTTLTGADGADYTILSQEHVLCRWRGEHPETLEWVG